MYRKYLHPEFSTGCRFISAPMSGIALISGSGLWSDIEDKAEARIQGEKSVPHFMGAVALEPQSRQGGLMGVEKTSSILSAK